MTHVATSKRHPAARARPPAQLAGVRFARRGIATLRSIVPTWDERRRLRLDQAQKLKGDPHLIADIGLRRRLVEAEIAKPFWQA